MPKGLPGLMISILALLDFQVAEDLQAWLEPLAP
jgi:hypothetical protein